MRDSNPRTESPPPTHFQCAAISQTRPTLPGWESLSGSRDRTLNGAVDCSGQTRLQQRENEVDEAWVRAPPRWPAPRGLGGRELGGFLTETARYHPIDVALNPQPPVLVVADELGSNFDEPVGNEFVAPTLPGVG